MESYSIIARVGKGAHGTVYKARHTQTGTLVALKRVILKRLDEGIPKDLLREIKALQQLEHENVVSLHDMFPSGLGVVLCFEFMATDVARVMQERLGPLPRAHVKAYMSMLLRGVAYCHSHDIIHRDLKPANLLLSSSGKLKIADFGLARVIARGKPMSHQVATRWYRAPELLYGAQEYDFRSDMWSVGCIFAEMVNNSPLFPGENDIDQLSCVIQFFGTPTVQDWPELPSLPDFNKISFDHTLSQPFSDLLPDADNSAIDFCKLFLALSASKRSSAKEALSHKYFFVHPPPAHHTELLSVHGEEDGGHSKEDLRLRFEENPKPLPIS